MFRYNILSCVRERERNRWQTVEYNLIVSKHMLKGVQFEILKTYVVSKNRRRRKKKRFRASCDNFSRRSDNTLKNTHNKNRTMCCATSWQNYNKMRGRAVRAQKKGYRSGRLQYGDPPITPPSSISDSR